MTISATNTNAEAVELEMAGKVNLKLGQGRTEPGDENE